VIHITWGSKNYDTTIIAIKWRTGKGSFRADFSDCCVFQQESPVRIHHPGNISLAVKIVVY